MQLRLASYNIHAGVGSDRRFNPQRLSRVLQQLDADIIALQEVVSVGPDGFALLDELAEACGMHAIAGATMMRGDASYGNALLTRRPYSNLRKLEFAVTDYEPRGALSVDIDLNDQPLTVAVTHLGLHSKERRDQIEQLLAWLPHPPARVVVLGDLNEWWPWSRNLRILKKHFSIGTATPTFPTRLPLLALDRILATPSLRLTPRSRFDPPLARIASDHLPLASEVTL
ncbi:MAG: endonuclease/exonuclease/phosphatase family protein [Pseudomonadota bacterium]